MEDSSDVLSGVGGSRVAWADVPEGVRISIQQHAGSPVVEAHSQPGGFSPALAARLVLSNGHRVFVKAIGPEAGASGGSSFYRREATIAAALPSGVPAPRFLDSWEIDGWVALMLEDVPDSRPPSFPWQPPELERVVGALHELSGMLTPPPISARSVVEALGGGGGWSELAESPGPLRGLDGLDPWIPQNIGALARLEAPLKEAAAGNTLLHSDLRADNILLTPNRVVFVDWPHASIGAPWLDLMFLLPSVAMQGGPEPDRVFSSHPIARGVDREAVVTCLAALGGYFFRVATRPAPPGLERLPTFARAQGEAAMGWLRRLHDPV